jgi:hypothetical protein
MNMLARKGLTGFRGHAALFTKLFRFYYFYLCLLKYFHYVSKLILSAGLYSYNCCRLIASKWILLMEQV